MYDVVRTLVPHHQITVVHANLGRVEWRGVEEHIRQNVDHEMNIVRANKTFFDMVRRRARLRPDVPAFPDAGRRQCTSDLKRGPIYKFIRRHMKRVGAEVGINCLGLRAEESTARQRKTEWSVNTELSSRRRRVYNWLPVHKLTRAEVFARIRQAGQRPFWAYEAGNERLSCVFCILGCANDLANGRRHRPELYEEYIALEHETGWRMFPKQSLAERASGGETPGPAPPDCWE